MTRDRKYDERQLAAMDAVLSDVFIDTMSEFNVCNIDVTEALIYVATEIDL